MKIVLLDSNSYFVGPHCRLCVKPFVTRNGSTVFMVHDAHLKRPSDEASPCINQFESLNDAFLYCRRVVKGETTPERHEAWL